MPLQSSGDERDSFLRRSRGASDGVRDSTPSACLVDAPRTSRNSSGPIGIALVDEGKDKVLSPRQRHIILREQLAEMSSDLLQAPTSPSPTRRLTLVLIHHFYNLPQLLPMPRVVLGSHC